MIVMHIGPHKTASTYIQNNLYEAREQLEARGWIYPELGTKGLPGHHDLAHNASKYLGPDAELGPQLTALSRKAREAKQNIVFSAEGFCRWAQPKLTGMIDHLEADHLDLVHVVRDPLDVFYSYWAEEVKQGYSVSLPERFSEHFSDPISSRLLNPMVDLRRFIRLDNIRLHAVPFEELRNREIDIFEHICGAVLGVPNIKAANTRPKNTSFPIELTEFLRLLNLIEGGGIRRLPGGSAMRLIFSNTVSQNEQNEIADLIRAEAPDARREIRFPAESSLKRRLSGALQANLERNWTLQIGKDELFRYDKERIYTHYDSYSLMQKPEIMDLARDVLARVSKRFKPGQPKH